MFTDEIKLGRSGLCAGRLGVGASYGAPADALEAAFDAGCNYFYWGALRRPQMAAAVRNIVARGVRERIRVVVQVFRRGPAGVEKSLMRGLKKLRLEYADVLLLGWVSRPPRARTLDRLEKLRESGAFRCLGVSGHNRALLATLAGDLRYDIVHVRYNAANRGAESDFFPRLADDRPGVVVFTATRGMSLVRSRRIPDFERRPTPGDCYRFALSNPLVDVVITAPSTAAQMAENLAAVAKGPMTADELEWIRRVGDYVYGKRRP